MWGRVLTEQGPPQVALWSCHHIHFGNTLCSVPGGQVLRSIFTESPCGEKLDLRTTGSHWWGAGFHEKRTSERTSVYFRSQRMSGHTQLTLSHCVISLWELGSSYAGGVAWGCCGVGEAPASFSAWDAAESPGASRGLLGEDTHFLYHSRGIFRNESPRYSPPFC